MVILIYFTIINDDLLIRHMSSSKAVKQIKGIERS